jgi:GTPase SAR1 family protein
MKADASNEQRFISEVDEFEFIASDVEKILRSLEGWLAHLNSDLESNRLTCAGLSKRSALAHEVSSIDTLLKESAKKWAHQWSHLEPAQALADSFADKVLLLIFGKFNAGKSSLCNFLADRFTAHGKTAEYFYLEAGRIVETRDRFKEGATETTARLQGVRLAGKLVFLDTPGLHSVTPENAALTQRFTDSADGVLWLSNSTAPGQVQELDELGRELHRNKPLLPVITRSDVFEEDEIDGRIYKLLRNKTTDNRAIQEGDVYVRAQEKLAAMGLAEALLKPPVSISVYVAREHKQTQPALAEAGFERLFAALLGIIDPTLAYKRRKAAETFLHHLEENVLGTICCEALPLLSELHASAKSSLAILEERLGSINNTVLRTVLPKLSGLLGEYAPTRDVTAICDDLSDSLFTAFSVETGKQLADYSIALDASLTQVRVVDEIKFDDIVVNPEGNPKLRELVGVDYQRLHAALSTAIRESVILQSRMLGDQCRASIAGLINSATCLENSLRANEQALLDLKRALRDQHR